MKAIQRRKAVFTALSKFFQGEQLYKILGYWDQEFYDQPVYTLNAFISRFVYDCEPKVSRTEIFKEIIFQFRQPEELLLDVPEQLNTGGLRRGTENYDHQETGFDHHKQLDFDYNKAFLKKRAPLPIELRVFTKFMDGLFEALPEDIELSVRSRLVEQVNKLRMDISVRSALRAWLQGNDMPEVESMSLNVLKELVGHCYVLLCEYIGPVDTDALIGYQANHVQNTEDGEQFSPYNFM